mmetsp:Transcript_64373/g.114473  ORF Transcript_64373/g.114473 Transcript_64373/m.114473 type:complete len:220 (-) Transcript_64373:955-1614(-)
MSTTTTATTAAANAWASNDFERVAEDAAKLHEAICTAPSKLQIGHGPCKELLWQKLLQSPQTFKHTLLLWSPSSSRWLRRRRWTWRAHGSSTATTTTEASNAGTWRRRWTFRSWLWWPATTCKCCHCCSCGTSGACLGHVCHGHPKTSSQCGTSPRGHHHCWWLVTLILLVFVLLFILFLILSSSSFLLVISFLLAVLFPAEAETLPEPHQLSKKTFAA